MNLVEWEGAVALAQSQQAEAEGRPDVYCAICRHYQGRRRCKAFPQMIPDEIFTSEIDHRKPFPGDHDIRFTPKASS